ncbi:hypothetical protein HDE_10823 [Halotydeus destructor]|nr:hypothetical protein HDE_10823 [Halotydeus destructor]
MPSLVDCLGREFDPNFRGPCLCQAGYTARGNFCVNKEYCEVDDDCRAFGHAASGYICESFRCVLNASKVSVGLDQVTTEQFKDEPPTTAQLSESIGSTLEDNRPESKVPFSRELLIGTCLLVTAVGVIVILTVRAKKMATFALSSVLDLTTAGNG